MSEAMRAILCECCSEVACEVPEHWSAERAAEECMQFTCKSCGEIGRVHVTDDGDNAGLKFLAVQPDGSVVY